jgi:ferritin-like protein
MQQKIDWRKLEATYWKAGYRAALSHYTLIGELREEIVERFIEEAWQEELKKHCDALASL